MIKALAPKSLRDGGWVFLMFGVTGMAALTASFPPELLAQDAPKAKSAEEPTARSAPQPAVPDAKTGGAPNAAPAAADDEADDAPVRGRIEIFKDPRAEAALEIFDNVPGLRDCRPNDINDVKRMAVGEAPIDRQVIQRFVDGMAYRLLDKGNINGLIAPDPKLSPNSASVRAIKDSTGNLIEALNISQQAGARGTRFRSAYQQALLETLPKLLDKNNVTRTEAMIVLGQAGDRNALPLFVNQLTNKDQTIWVKLWALRGISNVVEGGSKADAMLSVHRASEAGKAVAEFLKNEEDIPWPVQVRAAQAIGAMRQAGIPVNLRQAEIANAAMALLADSEARDEVRVWAAWAMGMVRVNIAADKYNFPLVAHAIGSLAAQLGEEVGACFGGDPAAALDQTRADYISSMLVGPIHESFFGLDGVRETGLLRASPAHPIFTSNQQAIREIADEVSTVAKSAVELVRAPPGQIPERQKELGDRISSLKTLLAKSAPKDFHLVPDGPEYVPAEGKSNAPVAAAPAAGQPVGR